MANTMLKRNEDYEINMLQADVIGQVASNSHDVYEIVCIVQGGAEYWIEEQFYKVHAGDILLIPVGATVSTTIKKKGLPFVRYEVRMSRRFMSFLKLQDEMADYSFATVAGQHRYLLRLPSQFSEALQGGFATAASEASDERFNHELSSKAMLSALIVQINRMVFDRGTDVLMSGDKNRLTPVLEYIHKHCTEALSVDGLAEQFDFSTSHLAHTFKKRLGTSLYHYVLMRRLQIGREAMLDGVPVKEAYERCGFGDYAGFYRAFIKEYGMSPQKYKKLNQ